MFFGQFLVTGATITEIVFFKDVGLFKQADGAIYGRNRNLRINIGRPTISQFDVGWSSDSESTRAITRRWPVIFRPASMHFCSIVDSASIVLFLVSVSGSTCPQPRRISGVDLLWLNIEKSATYRKVEFAIYSASCKSPVSVTRNHNHIGIPVPTCHPR